MNRAVNAFGQPEFASVVITFDHLTERPGPEIVQKIVLSTETAEQSLLSLIGYYKEGHLLTSAKTAELFKAAGANEDAVLYVYHTPQNVQVVCHTGIWDMLVMNPDWGNTSSLTATQKLLEVVATMQADIIRQTGGQMVPLFLIVPSLEEVEDEEEVDETAGVAADLADNAKVVDVTKVQPRSKPLRKRAPAAK